MREINWDQNNQMIFCAYVSKENFDHANLLQLLFKQICSIESRTHQTLYSVWSLQTLNPSVPHFFNTLT